MAFADSLNGLRVISKALDCPAIHLPDQIATLQAGIETRTSRLNVSDDDALVPRIQPKLFGQLRRDFLYCQPPSGILALPITLLDFMLISPFLFTMCTMAHDEIS